MNLILASHGYMAKETVNAAKMVFGEIADMDVVTFVPGENADTLKKKYQEIIAKYEKDTQILFLVDLFGGSPYNAAFETVIAEDRMDVITGLSLPMLIEVLGICQMEPDMKASEVVSQLNAESYMKSCKQLLSENSKEEEEDEL